MHCWVLWICVFPQTCKSRYIQDILQGHQAPWASWLCLKHQFCVYYRNHINIFPLMSCIANAAKVLTTVHKNIHHADLGMNSKGVSSIFRSHLKQRWQTASMNCQAVSQTPFLVKAHKITPLQKFFNYLYNLFHEVQRQTEMKEKARNRIQISGFWRIFLPVY